MVSKTFIYILVGVGILYLSMFFGLMRIKFFSKARQEYFSYYRKPIDEVARGNAMKAFFIWRAINVIIFIILIAILIGGVFAWQYFSAQKQENSVGQASGRLLSFEIVPSCKDKYSNTIYPEGAKAIARGEDLSKVEFWTVSSGAGLKDTLYTENGIIKENNQWETLLTRQGMWVPNFYAVGYDFVDKPVGKISLGFISEGRYPENCVQ